MIETTCLGRFNWSYTIHMNVRIWTLLAEHCIVELLLRVKTTWLCVSAGYSCPCSSVSVSKVAVMFSLLFSFVPGLRIPVHSFMRDACSDPPG